jgi:hypothetical protein
MEGNSRLKADRQERKTGDLSLLTREGAQNEANDDRGAAGVVTAKAL